MVRKICFVNLQAEKGGAQVFADEFVDELQKLCIPTTYIVDRRQFDEISRWVAKKQHIEVVVCNPFWFIGKFRAFKLLEIGCFPFYFLFLMITSLFDLKNVRCDVFYVNNGGYPGSWKQLAFCLAAKILKTEHVALIIHHKFGSSKILRPGEYFVHRLVAKFCDSVICVSEATKKSSNAHYKMFNKKIRVIENFVPEGLDNSIDNKPNVAPPNLAEFNRAKRNFNFPILLIGRLEPNKGQAQAIKALEASGFLAKNRNACLILIGARGHEKYSNEVFREIARCKFPIFWFDHLDISHDNLYANVACTFIASTEFEGFGLTAIEAMKRRVPVLATQVGALKSVVTSDRGFPVDLNRPADLLAALDCISQSGAQLQTVIRNGTTYASEKSRSKVVEEYLSVV